MCINIYVSLYVQITAFMVKKISYILYCHQHYHFIKYQHSKFLALVRGIFSKKFTHESSIHPQLIQIRNIYFNILLQSEFNNTRRVRQFINFSIHMGHQSIQHLRNSKQSESQVLGSLLMRMMHQNVLEILVEMRCIGSSLTFLPYIWKYCKAWYIFHLISMYSWIY